MLAGLFFLLLLLLVLPPPELMVLPPDIFLFRRLLGCCRAGSAGGGWIHTWSVPTRGSWCPPGPFMQTLLLQGPYSHSRLYHHLPHLPDQRTSEGAGTFPSLLCFPQVAGIPQAWSTGCLQPCSSPLGRETSIRKKPNAWFITPSLMKQGEEQLWGWEKPALRAGPEQAVPETPRQHSRQHDTHRVERPSAATFGRGKS